MATSVVWFFQIVLSGWAEPGAGSGFDWALVAERAVDWLPIGWRFLSLGIVPLYLWTPERQEAPSQVAVAAAVVTLSLAVGLGLIALTHDVRVPTLWTS
ncbi:MAG: hypothetical protein AAF417_00330 [Pseudomonadota bacterium]